ncbi:hypothetical protein Sjap_020388 [Stephania japonica]|uniref:Ribosome-inactivating protein n=1 Tax=Stephania japonica TaxID=461633 RepID=A0AAP0F9J1_9MAGN
MKIGWSAILAVWIWWVTIQSHQIWSSTSGPPLTADSKVGAPNYPEVAFDARQVDGEAYRKMLATLRNLLLVNGDYSHGIPVLRDPTTVPDTERYVLLIITGTNGQTVTLAIDVTNVYVIGYRVSDQRYFFTEAPTNAPSLLFTNITSPIPTRRSSNYNQLEARAGVRRTNIPLGLQSLLSAITTLTSQPENPRSLLIIIQMISEAIRFWEIESRVINNIAGEFRPDNYMIDLENNWGGLSEQIQRSDFLVFERAITIGNMVADSVHSFVIAGLYLIMLVCNPLPRSTTSFVSHLQLIKQQQLQPDFGTAETCKHTVEPTTRIRGRDGLCADVEGYVYRDNTPIVLFQCRTSDFHNQLWTFKKNGRIQSLGKCLAASGSTAGSGVVIHDCETLGDAALRWAMLYSGTLVNVFSGLALTARNGASGSRLTLEGRDFFYSTFSSWEATNNLSNFGVSIRGESNRCIYYNGRRGVYTETCARGSARQLWRIYPDNTIRPQNWIAGCLEDASLTRNNWIYIQAGRCDSSSESHKWVFRKGSIMNPKSNLVVNDDNANHRGYLNALAFNGGRNQLWTLQFTTL